MGSRFLSGIGGDEFVFGADDALLKPLPIPPKPEVQIPRSAKREYSADEVRSAARMMDLLRRGDDKRVLADHPPDGVADLVVERLLRRLEA